MAKPVPDDEASMDVCRNWGISPR